MNIGKVAQITGLSRDTLRYYEKFGLIEMSKKSRSENNYRQYNASTVEKLLLIVQLKNLGFTLNEIKDLNRRHELEILHCDGVGLLVKNKIQKIEQQINALQNTKKKLLNAAAACSGNCMETFNTPILND